MRAENAEAAPRRRSAPSTGFPPDIDSPFYGGINTALRIADYLAREHGVENQFVALADAQRELHPLGAAGRISRSRTRRLAFSDGQVGPHSRLDAGRRRLDRDPVAHGYMAANFPHTQRRFYLIQDFEPMFYPAGTNYALAEESYRLGLYGICNTERMLRLYEGRYGGEGTAFMPAVDPSVFHADGRRARGDGPVTVFTYARPGHWRNCWELASLGPRTAEAATRPGGPHRHRRVMGAPDDLGRGIEHLGLLDYRETGQLYRSCDLGSR